MDEDGRDLLVAASFVLAASEAVADRRSSQRKRWEAYARLYKKVKYIRSLPFFSYIKFKKLRRLKGYIAVHVACVLILSVEVSFVLHGKFQV